MNPALIVGGSLVLAILTAGLVGYLTASPATLFGATPIGIAIYLAVGIGLPQYLLGSDRDSSLQVGLAGLAVTGAVLSILAGVVSGSVTNEWSIGVTAVLVIVVVGTLLGATVRAFRAGYRSGS